jgi:DNA-directed RNA polymerase specialized sigma subunit
VALRKSLRVNEREEVPQGISEASRKATKARSKIPAQAGETELEGEIAQRDRIRPTRQVPSQLIWRDREAVKFERAAEKTADRGIPMDSEEHVL